MKKKFYNNLFNKLKEKGQLNVITIVKGSYKGTSLIGEKCLKSEDEILDVFWRDILKKINFSNGSTLLKVNDNLEVFIEFVSSKPDLVICGGGHIALPLCQLGRMVEFKTTIIDDREEFANISRFPMADRVICKDFSKAIDEIKPNRSTYFVIITRGHKDDRKCLETILKNNFFYVGMIGSKGKISYIINNLLENGFSKEEISKLHSPIGLNIGAQTPEEIAVSIIGEIILEKNQKEASIIEENILNSICNRKEPMILATIIDKHGSCPRGVGTKMLIYENTEFVGTVGGGSIENAVYEKALELIKNRKSSVEVYDLSNSEASNLGMVCGGSLKVLFEFIE
ncbi:XdhC family protein [Clostridium sp. SHJSY1]|uniref:XdhC family protein n=1 Tax=Clostridium sp. SHJSY1 TaxID=2942483 RepID=UPI00287503C7|nr:XdhC family protein [Clostridium sp. SHJSY1]MDS0524607.1 XdhC family protein [Clostridium sp. SHJSY1]